MVKIAQSKLETKKTPIAFVGRNRYDQNEIFEYEIHVLFSLRLVVDVVLTEAAELVPW